jgi:hypothetical protein
MNASRLHRLLIAGLLMAALLGCTWLVQVTPTAQPAPTPASASPRPPTGSALPPSATRTATPTAPPTGSVPPPVGSVLPPGATITATPTAPPTAGPAASAQPPAGTPADLYLEPGGVRVQPGPEQYSGDVLTVQVLGRNAGRVSGAPVEVAVTLDGPGGPRELARGALGGVTLGGAAEALFERVWDTHGLSGTYTLTVQLDPDGRVTTGDESQSDNRAVVPVVLRPAGERPAAEINARWAVTTTLCCAIHYLTGTAVERDLAQITADTEQAAEYVEGRIGGRLNEPVQIYYIDRVLGHGGFAGGAITISYLDRNYPAGDFYMVVRHETTHILDRTITDARIAALAEGLAVYIAGGHFKPEDVDQRAAELVRFKRYVPLRELVDNFYPTQHETSYLEGAAFISYLVQRFGWNQFKQVYRAAGTAGGQPSQALDGALRQAYGEGLDALEADWLAALAARPYDPAVARDLLDTLRYYDAVRAYQQAYDPTAYYLEAWLPDPAQVEREGDTAVFERHPRAPENVALETMLIEAMRAMNADDFDHAESLLGAIEATLAAHDFAAQPLAHDYLAVVQALAAQGDDAVQISLAPDGLSATAQVLPAEPGAPLPAPVAVRLERAADGWRVVP